MTNPDDRVDIKALREALEELRKREQHAVEVLKILEIPVNNSGSIPLVNAVKLVEILMNEEKLKVLVSKLRNKAFW